jgi:type II secretory pathway pseudopilin PulG
MAASVTLDHGSAPRNGALMMTTITQTQRRNPPSTLVGLTLAAALLAGLGGVVGSRIQAIVQQGEAQAKAAEQAKWDAYGAEWQRLYRAQQGHTLSPRDEAVLEAAQAWEARYRQMYPDVR